ncbi:MAG: acyl-CoA dehydrogenase family protein [Chloroflexota bacterium]|nr:acyl-CoA dehydrogenase family protein [Chloroflexota bacterium]
MATVLTQEYVILQRKIDRFARQHIGNRDDLQSLEQFPRDIWTKMGKQGLLGLGIPKEYGGLGGNYVSIATAGESLMRSGHNMGITISWLIHCVVSRFLILGFGTTEQHNTYLPELASGKITASIAVSEPGSGAHPKRLQTIAYHRGGIYTLQGEKSYLTNGPMADLFIVFATTGMDGERKLFTAFLVPSNTKGLCKTEPMKLEYLKPSEHGGIVLCDCRIPTSSILGAEGSGYDDMAKPFREVEDALMMGLLVGGMSRQQELLLNLIAKQGYQPTDELKTTIGELQAIVHTLRIMAYEAASMLDSSTSHPEFLSLIISFRNLAKQFQDLIETVLTQEGIEKDPELQRTTNELALGIEMSKNIALMKQQRLGAELLSGKESDEVPAT